MKALPDQTSAVAVRDVQSAGRIGDKLPKIGEYFWVTFDQENESYVYPDAIIDKTAKKKKQEKVRRLMCVEHIASNHIELNHHYAYRYKGSSREKPENYKGESSVKLSFQDFMTDCHPEPNWKGILQERMDAVRDAMEQQTRLLYEEAQKANALPQTETQFMPTEAAPFALAIRTMDPMLEKRNLKQLQKRIPLVANDIQFLAKEQACLAKMLMLPELNNLYAMEKKLHVVEDKIFTLEVYAGLQEKVKQIGNGKAAPPDTKITVRQSLLFMDEETLIDFDKGGMDFCDLSAFDEWVAQPASLARVLPEPKGIVAFRVRRHEKNYGPITELWQAFAHAAWNAENFTTYLLIRNGERVYRIASAVDFQPRLIPLADEFAGAFTEEHRHHEFGKSSSEDRIETKRITPDNFDYDEHAEKLRNHLKQYNRVVVLLQGLLDRSEVFHPHPPINLAHEAEMMEWMNLIRDEEGALGAGALSETWEEYRDRCNATLEAGDFIYSGYRDLRRRPYDATARPSIITVQKVRVGTRKDIIPKGPYSRVRQDYEHYGMEAEECVGVPGVEVEWDGGDVWRRSRWGDNSKKPYTGRMWIPLAHVFNLMEYTPGDYKKFLCDRTQKGAYLQWAPQLLSAEKWHQKMAS